MSKPSKKIGRNETYGPKNLTWLIATWFGIGKIKYAPGTCGSLAALPFAYLIHTGAGEFGIQALLSAALLLFLIGTWAAEDYMEKSGVEHDPGEIVVDEVMGQWLLLAAFAPTLQAYAIGFVLFRFFDIMKPWPIRHFDRRVMGGFGVMFDDFLAGMYPIILIGILALLSMIIGNAAWLEYLFSFIG